MIDNDIYILEIYDLGVIERRGGAATLFGFQGEV